MATPVLRLEFKLISMPSPKQRMCLLRDEHENSGKCHPADVAEPVVISTNTKFVPAVGGFG